MQIDQSLMLGFILLVLVIEYILPAQVYMMAKGLENVRLLSFSYIFSYSLTEVVIKMMAFAFLAFLLSERGLGGAAGIYSTVLCVINIIFVFRYKWFSSDKES